MMDLALGSNDLIGFIPNTINKLHCLQRLILTNNRLQGSIINELCQLKSLSELYLANNMFSGIIPGCFGNTSLRKLDFSSNKLISQIPDSLWSLNDILHLDISSNAPIGMISPKVSNLRAITLLNLSKNQISGSIPATMGDLQTLLTLSLAQNKLQGPIPESLSNMISIESMDLSHNYLYGMIPKSFESLLYLKYINLSYNLLDGEIPNGGPFSNFTAESFMMNKDLCGKSQLQVQPCRKGNKHISNKAMLIVKFLLPITVVILIVLGIVFLKHKRDYDNYRTTSNLVNLDAPTRISYYELLHGTNGFDERNLLGSGSFGSVYKATLSNEEIVAVKVFNSDMEEASRSFDIECAVMRNLRHHNLIKIISSCSNDHFKSLIMEFMENGSLDRWLYSHSYYLDVLQRLNIMIDVALALEYLHHGSPTLVVHCDVKPSNVLLDKDMVAHLSDFGISKLFSERQLKSIPKLWLQLAIWHQSMDRMELFLPKEMCLVMGFCLWKCLRGRSQQMTSLNCCIDLPEARCTMTDVVVSLKNIKALFLEHATNTTS
ncbi:hypothetical protein K1719_041075 [Acacia pycnantha]|nr:hypothetical protein K1719_041075 [Acacia pycnantha]